jgi:hypothetical protein
MKRWFRPDELGTELLRFRLLTWTKFSANHHRSLSRLLASLSWHFLQHLNASLKNSRGQIMNFGISLQVNNLRFLDSAAEITLRSKKAKMVRG